jgi:hypothetical protein
MLCFPQMATKAQISAEQYLDMTFEHDAEFIHTKRRAIFTESGPQYVSSLALAEYPFELTPSSLFSDL